MSAVSEQDLVQLNALADGELEPAAAAALRRRLAADPMLEARYDAIIAGREAVARLPRPMVSDDFLRRIEAETGAAAASPPRRRASLAGWQSIAASVAITALLASSATYLLLPRAMSADDLIASSHRRSLLAASAVDVASSDRHTVKPWLDAKLGVSPPAPDLAAQGYPLLGGRVEVIGEQTVPTLVYRHNEHTISLVAMPGSLAASAPHDLAAGGYNMVRWSGSGFDFWAVSDLEPGELDSFVGDYRTVTTPTPTGR